MSTMERQPMEGQPQGPKPAEPKPAEPKPAESKPAESKPEKSNILMDVKIEENNAKHHTDQMSTTKLIMRRGLSFSLALKFKEQFNPAVHELRFTATVGNIPDEIRGTKSVFGIPDNVKPGPNAKAIWKAALKPDQKKSRNVVVNITPPADAPVGIYTLLINYLGEEIKLELALIFNPWCTDDSVYMKNEKKIQEYVMNERGVIYKGSNNYIFPMLWDYGQFEEDMVEIALALLHVSPEYLTDPMKDEDSRCDPIYVGRIISRMINSEGDRGVLEGRWGGPYTGGKTPSHWSGSYPILKRWYNIGCHPVKYGQCWVFAAVMCSVMRTLGIPCRVVTNYSSAHDCDKNLTIDVYHADYGVEEIPSPDSVWNFHVWCEGWMKRPDLLDGKFDGWQVVDATPQELSGGSYQCGPAPVKAILNGNTDVDYDVPFVFAEVNADCIDWLVYADGSKESFWSDSSHVGQNISTKTVGSHKRHDITRKYKHEEGSEKERAVFKYAITRESIKDEEEDWDEEDFEDSEDEAEEVNPTIPEPEPEPEKPPPKLPKVSLKFEEVSKPVNGKDVELKLLLHSEATEPRTLSINISVIAKSINGTARHKILSDKKEKTLKPGRDLRIPVVVPFDKYWPKMVDNDVMNITAIVKDMGDAKEKYLAENDVVLEDPPFKVQVFGDAKIYRPVFLEMFFANPVSETLKNCTITLSGSGLLREEEEISLPDLGPKRNLRVKVRFCPYKAGKKTLMADFDCSVFRDIKKSVPINVQK